MALGWVVVSGGSPSCTSARGGSSQLWEGNKPLIYEGCNVSEYPQGGSIVLLAIEKAGALDTGKGGLETQLVSRLSKCSLLLLCLLRSSGSSTMDVTIDHNFSPRDKVSCGPGWL